MTILTGDYTNVAMSLNEGTLTLSASGTISSTDERIAALAGGGLGSLIRIQGLVDGAGNGVELRGYNNLLAIAETGSVTGATTAVLFTRNAYGTIDNAGFIGGGANGVYAVDGAAIHIDNSGTIAARFAAVQLGIGDDRVDNSGLLQGAVLLGGGNDRLDSHAGRLAGGVRGEAGDDELIGSAYADRLLGDAGDDVLTGGEGRDWLDGGAGADELHGGAGLDLASYDQLALGVVASLSDPSRNTGGAAGDSYDGIEGLVGTSLRDHLTGDHAANRLDGYRGNDVLTGLRGNDLYFVDSRGDRVVEVGGGGYDTVRATVSYSLADTAVERLYLDGTADGRTARGNALDNVVRGSAGGDTLAGGLGGDTLTGGAGFDNFRFDTTPSARNADTISDFDRTDDQLWFDRDVYTALGGAGTRLPSAEFRAGTHAQDRNDHIVYDIDSGRLWYDADGSGSAAQVLVATLLPGTALTAAEIYGVA